MLEKALRLLLERKAKYESEVLQFPPQTLEQLQYKVGRYQECLDLIAEIEMILKGLEDD